MTRENFFSLGDNLQVNVEYGTSYSIVNARAAFCDSYSTDLDKKGPTHMAVA